MTHIKRIDEMKEWSQAEHRYIEHDDNGGSMENQMFETLVDTIKNVCYEWLGKLATEDDIDDLSYTIAKWYDSATPYECRDMFDSVKKQLVSYTNIDIVGLLKNDIDGFANEIVENIE